MVEKMNTYWMGLLKQRLDRAERIEFHVVPTQEVDLEATLYTLIMSKDGIRSEIGWNLPEPDAEMLVRHLRRSFEAKRVGAEGEAYLEFAPDYFIEKQKERI